ncbi:hypothetical protein EYF80_058547 [Liparis tanakae]|uniref:Uncharacterized protein n=1 Tax=Liparis tanakae TaxID=230148 RepID=A0A4Z2ERT7_9TELE|nr:hypothetical protein EYF80_058547 [Liparis tanakae]
MAASVQACSIVRWWANTRNFSCSASSIIFISRQCFKQRRWINAVRLQQEATGGVKPAVWRRRRRRRRRRRKKSKRQKSRRVLGAPRVRRYHPAARRRPPPPAAARRSHRDGGGPSTPLSAE